MLKVTASPGLGLQLSPGEWPSLDEMVAWSYLFMKMEPPALLCGPPGTFGQARSSCHQDHMLRDIFRNGKGKWFGPPIESGLSFGLTSWSVQTWSMGKLELWLETHHYYPSAQPNGKFDYSWHGVCMHKCGL